jgi:4a-hydroxytetrahydrobiopterin dehydratase
MERQKLSAEEIENRAAELDDWTVANNKLARKFTFNNFSESLDFVNRVGAIADLRDHHPDILFGWGYAEFFITTHDAGGITERDFALAREINEIRHAE